MIALNVLTSIGHVTIERRYLACGTCKGKAIPWDDWAGVENRHMSQEARRMLSLAGNSWSFDTAAGRLKELCHIEVSDDTIERVCQEEGERARHWLRESDRPAQAFARAGGQAEFYSDGVKINTVDGWREMRLSVLAKRKTALPASPGQWKDRVLEEPTVRMAVCAIAPAHVVGSSWKRLAGRLGLKAQDDPLSVIADGAKWIWIEAAKRFGPDTRWIVDVFHVSEHLHACGKQMLGEGAAARQWAEGQLQRLIEIEGPRFIEELDRGIANGNGSDRPALEKLRSYLNDNRDSLWYATRLAQGLPIGSGLIEGACKNTIGARLKINSARWRVRRAERIGALRCLEYSGQWEPFWQKRVA